MYQVLNKMMMENWKSKYIIFAVLMLFVGLQTSIAQTNKKKASPKQKISKIKSDSTANAIAMDTVTNAHAKVPSKNESKKQDKKDVKDEEVELSRPYQPTLSEGYKISNSPQIEQAKLDVPKMDYSVTPKAFPTWYDVLPINAAKMKDEKLEPQTGNLVKLGYGNYDNAFGELFLNNTQNKDYSIAAYLKHFSSTGEVSGYKYSQFSNNLIDFYGKRYLDNETISGDISYRRNVVNYYGYDDTNSFNIKQLFNLFNAQVGFLSNNLDNTKFYHDVNLNLYSLGDKFSNNEFGISLNGLLKGSIGKDQWITGNIIVDNSSFKQGSYTNTSNMLIGLAPQYTFKQKDLNLGIGFNGQLENNGKSNAHLYPKIDFSYSFADNSLKLYATFTGETVKNTFKTISAENPFIEPQILGLANTNNKKDFYAGLKGSLSNTMSFNLRAGYKDVANMPFYMGYSIGDIPQNNFIVNYDTFQVINAHLELCYQQSENLRIILSGDYNHYKVTTQQYAWYKPNESIGLSFVDNIDKFTIKGDVFFLSDREANPGFMFIMNAPTSVDLKPIVDINIGVEYHYTKALSFFLNLNNIANSQYQIWYEYPVQRFNLLGGLSYAF